MSSGDREWGERVRSRGLALAYADEVRVSHVARRSLADLCAKTLRIAGGKQRLADQRGEGTSGVLAQARRQLVLMRRIRANVGDARLGGLSHRIRFAAIVWFLELLATIERYRVHYGGTPRRT
jgi:hypothetical protein